MLTTTAHRDHEGGDSDESAAVEVESISKRWGAVRALTNVSLRATVGEVVGLVGENGAGKSTLIGVISGTVRPDSGVVRVAGEPAPVGDSRRLAALGVSVVMQEQSLVENLRVDENLFLGIESLAEQRLASLPAVPAGRRWRRRTRYLAQSMLDQVGLHSIPVDARVGTLSFPQRQMVEIAKAFVAAELRNRLAVILLDEPTSALSRREAELLFALIEQWRDRAVFLYVSHVLNDVRRIATRIVVLKDGVVVDDLVNDGIDESRLHELMVGRVRNADYYQEGAQRTIGATAVPSIELVGAGAAGLFHGVDFPVLSGEIVGLAGVVGSGASEIAAALAGAVPVDEGALMLAARPVQRWNVRAAIRAGVLYVPPERATDAIFAHASSAQNVSIGLLDQVRSPITRIIDRRRERQIVERLVKRMRVRLASIRTPAGELSGGNQQKLVFARWLHRLCKVMVLDDPTRGVDVGTREELYHTIRELAATGVAIVLRSESLEELIGLSNRIVVVKGGAITAVVDAAQGAKPDEIDIIRHMI